MRRRTAGILLAAACVAGMVSVALAVSREGGELPAARGDALFELKHYAEAADAYAEAVKGGKEGWRRAAQRLILCKLRLGLYDDAIAAAEDYIARTAGTPYEARAERLCGHLYMLLPHWGTRSGGKFHRADSRQGIRLVSYQFDKKRAVAHMERARELYARYEANPAALSLLPAPEQEGWHDERIGCLFDLANLLSRFSIYDEEPRFWYRWWGERDEFLAATAGERDFDEEYSYREMTRKRPIGLRLDAEGKPIFPRTPHEYSPDLADDEKILYLLEEVRKLDRSPNAGHTALSYYRQAMLARKRFGMDRLNACARIYNADGRMPLVEELQALNPWELGDSEALVLAGGRIVRATLPEQFDVLALLRKVIRDCPESPVAARARYAAGLYYQSRQQYNRALDEYAALMETEPESEWAADARKQVARIEAPQVRLSQAGLRTPGQPATLLVSYRNAGRLWFTARRIDLKGLFDELRAGVLRKDDRSGECFSLLARWSYCFVRRDAPKWQRRLAARHLGADVTRWSSPVPDDGSHRYAQATIQAPLSERGAYFVQAYADEPRAPKDGLAALDGGLSRAVIVLNDLAFVSKRTTKGNLIYVADAVSGSPVPGANVSVLEFRRRYDRKGRRWNFDAACYRLTTGADGMALHGPGKGQLSVLVSAPDGRLAWSGMPTWWYSPARMKVGQLAYTVTDRPVYRPGQTVRFKVWVRQATGGELHNVPHREFSTTVLDPRGNKVYEVRKRTDDYGGLDGEFRLSEEATLGIYRVRVSGERYVGGGNFRVEEYKKPEFEVTVEPDTRHARLGQRVGAVIRARYYFGAPVTDATVSYRVLREEYGHHYCPPGRWDWLYGPGYGLGRGESERVASRGGVRFGRIWPGFRPPSRVRELVQEGTAPIGADGTLRIEIDTAPALREHADRDHRYIIQAEVRDPSRRVISGEGDVKVTRRAFYAFVSADRGYCRPGEEMQVTVRCVTPDDAPVRTDGIVSISRVVFGGPDNARIEETLLRRWKASTDERGVLTFRVRPERSGRLKIKFAAPDEWGGTVEGYGLVWVCGRDFDGRLYRFNDLELLTDRRTYRPGDTCHLMITTRRRGSYVLFADRAANGVVASYRLLHLPAGHAIVDVPITRADVPNFFVEAMTVSDLRLHQQALSVCVPPVDAVADVTVSTDKGSYRPGEKATVRVSAKTPDGEPAQVQVALSVFDASVLYIQNQFAPQMAKFFHGRLRRHHPEARTNLVEQFAAEGYVQRPFQELQPLPPAWTGTWGVTVEDWAAITDEELQALSGGRARRRFAVADRIGVSAKAAPMAAMAPEASAEAEQGGAPGGAGVAGGGGAGLPGLAPAKVRKEFADTALWLPALTTGPDGTASTTFEMPENLTTWKLAAWAMSKQTRVGQASAEAVTTKDLLVRLQAPRFLVERDEVVLSANVHNYLAREKLASVTIELPAGHLALVEGQKATVQVRVPPGGQKRVDWRARVLRQGRAAVTVKALTDEESDAMQLALPVLVHGARRQETWCGAMRPQDAGEAARRAVEFSVPQQRRPALTELEVEFSPTLVGAMLDALPYCLDYPYGCAEQTVSRFLPAVLTLKTLRNMGIALEDVREIRGRMAEVGRVEKGQGIRPRALNPVFDSDRMYDIINRGLTRIADMQHPDGGWSWWKRGESSGYMTSYVLYALLSAARADVAVDPAMLERGAAFLQRWELEKMREKSWRPNATHAFAAYVLALKGMQAEDCVDRLYEGRDRLGLYGKALLSLTLAELGDAERARLVLRNIMQYLEQNPETGIAWFRTPSAGWWYWHNSDIETNAWCLRAMVRLEPQSDVAPRVVKWLLENRRNGYYWRSTRDTTLCVAAMSEFVADSGETEPDYTLTVDLDDGAFSQRVRITPDNFLTCPSSIAVPNELLTAGPHRLTINKDGPGALYYSVRLRYFSTQKHIRAAGLQLKLERTYYLLRRIPYTVEVEGAEGQAVSERRLRYERVPLKEGDRVRSGDLIQVELRARADNDYTYLVFEDPKPAGCEALELRSGGQAQEGFFSYMELRDEKTAFFVPLLGRGEHLLRYRLRAEVPGVFHALPAALWGMYVPELRGNSDEAVVTVEER